MMMLQGTKHSDSPVIESRPKEVNVLPPLSTNRKCIQNCDSADDSDDESRTSQFLTTRWRSKPKKGHDRLTVNQSSMSDSFVLPRINGSSQSNTEHHDRTTRKSRTSLSFPKRSRDTCIPLSKSCPALMNNTWRRSSRVGDTTDGYEDDYDDDDDDDDEDSESSPQDLKSRSHNTELLRVRRSHGQIDENCNNRDDITDGVVRKLAKLESPRGKINHLQGRDCHHKSKESETKLPDIFNNPNGLSQQLFRSPDHGDQGNPRTSQGNIRTRHGNIKSKSHSESVEPEFRVPESIGGVRDNSFDMDCSPWDANGKGDEAAHRLDNASDRQYSKASTRVVKKKRKQQKRQRTHGEQLDRPNLIRDVSQADIKCRTWLVEGHQESAPKLATSEQPEVV